LRVRFEGEECATPAHILGLHILTEVVDGRFTDMHFDNGTGGIVTWLLMMTTNDGSW
jgi:hypothetical protein